MIRQILVELTRLRWRRAILVLLASSLVIPLAVALIMILSTSAPTAADQRQAEKQQAQIARMTQRDFDRCLANPDRYGIDAADPDELDRLCRDYTGIDYLGEDNGDYYYNVSILRPDREIEEGSGLLVAIVLVAWAFLVGTTFVGHDWNTGSMSNQVLVRSRRGLIWSAKGLAVAAVGAVVALVGAGAYTLLMYAVASSREFPSLAPGALGDLLAFDARIALFAAAAGFGGYALTMLSRSTVFSLGLIFGIALIGETLLNTVGPEDPGPWSPTYNAAAIVTDGTTYYVRTPDICYSGESVPADVDCSGERTRTLGQGVGYYAVVLGLLGAASAVSFRRRDLP